MNRHRRRRGFAMIYALTILGLVALALYVLADHFSFEMRRTNNTQADAQQHQLLLAGNDFVTAEAAKWPEKIEFKSADVAVPGAPVDAKTTVSIKLLSSDAGVAKVEVSTDSKPHNSSVENLILKFSDGHWHIIGAELIGE